MLLDRRYLEPVETRHQPSAELLVDLLVVEVEAIELVEVVPLFSPRFDLRSDRLSLKSDFLGQRSLLMQVVIFTFKVVLDSLDSVGVAAHVSLEVDFVEPHLKHSMLVAFHHKSDIRLVAFRGTEGLRELEVLTMACNVDELVSYDVATEFGNRALILLLEVFEANHLSRVVSDDFEDALPYIGVETVFKDLTDRLLVKLFLELGRSEHHHLLSEDSLESSLKHVLRVHPDEKVRNQLGSERSFVAADLILLLEVHVESHLNALVKTPHLLVSSYLGEMEDHEFLVSRQVHELLQVTHVLILGGLELLLQQRLKKLVSAVDLLLVHEVVAHSDEQFLDLRQNLQVKRIQNEDDLFHSCHVRSEHAHHLGTLLLVLRGKGSQIGHPLELLQSLHRFFVLLDREHLQLVLLQELVGLEVVFVLVQFALRTEVIGEVQKLVETREGRNLKHGSDRVNLDRLILIVNLVLPPAPSGRAVHDGLGITDGAKFRHNQDLGGARHHHVQIQLEVRL